MNTGERIKKRRKELGISLDDVALAIRKNRVTVYRYEKGSIEKIPTSVLIPLAKVLSTTPDYLIGDEENSQKEVIEMNESKKDICYKLLGVLKSTTHLHDLVDLEYFKLGKDDEVVIATFSNGCSKKVNVSLDSGIAMIADIVSQL